MVSGGHTNKQTEALTFGRLLKSLRTQRGIDLQTISDETRIAVAMLRCLEEEAHGRLPDTIFVKGFLKSYAEALGTPEGPIIQNYLVERNYYQERKRLEGGRGKSGASSWIWPALAVFLLACILYATLRTDGSKNENQGSETAATPAGTAVLPEIDTQPSVPEPEARKDSYRLQVNAVEESWLKVIVDRQEPKKYHLNPGDRLELKATSGFNLLIGNAAGIHLQLDNKAIPVEGRHGQMVTLKLPK